MRITKKKTAVVIAVASVAIAGAGGAFAYWTTGGTGTGSASAGSNVDFTLEQVGDVEDLVLDVPQTVNFKVTNSATFAQMLNDVAVTVDDFEAQANTALPACTEADFAISEISIADGEIAAGSTRNGTATITLLNSSTNQDNCKDAEVALTFRAS